MLAQIRSRHGHRQKRRRLGLQALAALFLLAAPARAEGPSIGEMAGQMIMTGFEGDTLTSEGFRAVIADLEAGRTGGVLFLGHNIRGRETVIAMTAAIKACRCKHPPLIAVDEEGGKVERLGAEQGFHEDPSAMTTARIEDKEKRREIFARLAADVADAGFNINLAPVADLDLNAANRVIGGLKRSYGRDGHQVAALAREFIDAHRARGLLTALKHFPGHGSSAGDTHRGYADVTDTWTVAELVPFQALIAEGGADLVMTGHIASETWSGPATLAPSTAISGLLRGTLRFDGVVISDDLDMGAVRANSPDFDKTIRRAVEAGNDILIYSNHTTRRPGASAEIYSLIAGYAAANEVSRAKLRESFDRIVALKKRVR